MIRELLKKNTSWAAAGEMWQKAALFIITIIIARRLGDTLFGQYTFIVAYIQLFQILLDAGLQLIATRDVSRLEHKNIGDEVNVLFALKILLAIATITILTVITIFIDKPADIKGLIFLQAAYMLFFSMNDLFRSILKAREKFKLEAFIRILEGSLVVALVVIFIPSLSVGKVILSFVITIVTVTLVTMTVLKKQFGRLPRPVYNWQRMKVLVEHTWPLALAAAFVIVYFRIDTVMLSFISGDKPTGWYNAAFQLIYALLFVPMLIMMSFYARLSRFAQESIIKTRELYKKSLLFMIGIAALLMAGVYLIAPWVIQFAYGDEFLASIEVLRILTIAVFISFVSHVFMFTLTALNKQKLFPIPAAIGMVLNIVLNLIFIPKYSYIAASWTTVVTECFTGGALLCLTHYHLYIKPNKLKKSSS